MTTPSDPDRLIDGQPEGPTDGLAQVGAIGVPAYSLLPSVLPASVADFLAAQAIVTRAQAAVCLARITMEPALLAGIVLDPADIRQSLALLGVDVAEAITAEVGAMAMVPPMGVPLGLIPEGVGDGSPDLGDILSTRHRGNATAGHAEAGVDLKPMAAEEPDDEVRP